MMLRALHVEDDLADAELIARMLRRAGLDPEIVRVETQEQFMAALDMGRFDLVLADLKLPKFDGLLALSLSAEKCPEVPFIFVSGTIGEEAAIETLKHGATDYVLKQRLSRLVPAVRRALDEALERRKRQRAENMFRTALEASPNGVLLSDSGGKITLVNAKILDLFGYAAHELIGRPVEILMPERYREKHGALRANYMVSPQVRSIGAGRDLVGLRKDGSEFPIEIGLNPVELNDDRAIIASIIDITERKRAEEALRERVQLAEFVADMGFALTEELGLRPMLQKCAETMVRHLAAAFARIWTVNAAGNMLELQASAGMYTHIDGGHSRVPVGSFKIGLIAYERKPHLTNAVVGDPRVGDQEWAKREGMVAFAGYPLMVENRLIGVMAMFARKPLSDAVVQAMASVANEVAAGIERKFAEERVRRNYERIWALHEIDTAISSTLDLITVLDLLLEKSAVFLPDAGASYARLFERNGTPETVACYNLEVEEWKARVNLEPGHASALRANSGPVTVRNLQTSPWTVDREFFRKHGLVSHLEVPLTAEGQCVGVLGFYTKWEHEFAAEEIDFAATLAGQAIIAIQNAQLYEKIKLAKTKVEFSNQVLDKSLRQLSSLYTALAPLQLSETADQMLEGIINRLMESTGADAALIRLRDHHTGAYSLASHRGFPDYYLDAYRVIPAGGAMDWVYRNRAPVIAPDIAHEPRLKGKIQLQLGLRSSAMLPLMVRGEVRGIIHLASRTLGYFDEQQKDHLLTIARQLSIALENRELFDNLKASRDDLERANRVKDQFLSVVSHELKTPLNIITGYAGVLKDGMVGELNPPQENALQKVLGSAKELHDIIDRIMQATRIDSGRVAAQYRPLDLRDFLERLRLDFASQGEKEGVDLAWDYPESSTRMVTDDDMLTQILHNLINNALKFTKQGTVAVSARVLSSVPDPGHRATAAVGEPAAWVEFRVTDTGIGIPRETREHIFNKFYQVDSSPTRAHEGCGLGLYIVKNFAELLGGKLEFESEPGKGSTFTVTLPS